MAEVYLGIDIGIDILRQNVYNITYNDDFTTVIMTVLESTFNRAGVYRVVVNDGAMRNLKNDQPLTGFGWNFTVGM